MARSETCLIWNCTLQFSALCNLVKRTNSEPALGKESWVILSLSLYHLDFPWRLFGYIFNLDFAYLWDLLRLESKTEWLQWNRYKFHLHPALSQREIIGIIQAVCISQVRDHWDQNMSEIPLVRAGYRQWQIVFCNVSYLLFQGMKILDPLLVRRLALSFLYSNTSEGSVSLRLSSPNLPKRPGILFCCGCTCPRIGAAWQWDPPPVTL